MPDWLVWRSTLTSSLEHLENLMKTGLILERRFPSKISWNKFSSADSISELFHFLVYFHIDDFLFDSAEIKEKRFFSIERWLFVVWFDSLGSNGMLGVGFRLLNRLFSKQTILKGFFLRVLAVSAFCPVFLMWLNFCTQHSHKLRRKSSPNLTTGKRLANRSSYCSNRLQLVLI